MAESLELDDVSRILDVPPARVRAMVAAGLCSPERRGRKLCFSFQDLVILRAAKGLLEADVPPRRLRNALKAVARQLPPGKPLSGLRIYADGRQVVVQDGRAAWQPANGQVLLNFDVDELAADAAKVQRLPARPVNVCDKREEAQALFDQALATEDEDPDGARALYREALRRNPDLHDAQVNLGRLAFKNGEIDDAIALYHEALKSDPDDAIAHYNLAMALEDDRRAELSVAHYRKAIELDGGFAEAHYNLAHLLEKLGERTHAIRHLSAYKRLTRG